MTMSENIIQQNLSDIVIAMPNNGQAVTKIDLPVPKLDVERMNAQKWFNKYERGEREQAKMYNDQTFTSPG